MLLDGKTNLPSRWYDLTERYHIICSQIVIECSRDRHTIKWWSNVQWTDMHPHGIEWSKGKHVAKWHTAKWLSNIWQADATTYAQTHHSQRMTGYWMFDGQTHRQIVIKCSNMDKHVAKWWLSNAWETYDTGEMAHSLMVIEFLTDMCHIICSQMVIKFWRDRGHTAKCYQMFNGQPCGKMVVIKWSTDKHMMAKWHAAKWLLNAYQRDDTSYAAKWLSNVQGTDTHTNSYGMLDGQTLSTWHAAKCWLSNVWQTDDTGQMTRIQIMVIEYLTDRWHIINSQIVIEWSMNRHTDKWLLNVWWTVDRQMAIWLSNVLWTNMWPHDMQPHDYQMFDRKMTLAKWHIIWVKWLSNVWQTDDTSYGTQPNGYWMFGGTDTQPNGYWMFDGQPCGDMGIKLSTDTHGQMTPGQMVINCQTDDTSRAAKWLLNAQGTDTQPNGHGMLDSQTQTHG